ncbi:helix-turn-helix transcriptional regulator [Phytomonospora endophytica]|uniref:Transcriptional regulator with XRE-family HTH domain n=1 Tax=Phytomonospora endophytica TaxID=714109 RepID=A0A841FYX9_9ACTN|nr:helix-turn-helix transcriptional regulator [Phytomonospora endophytica]MBB6037160.1 transcriptional regulator with XRE-family HTH domain [Phytomonospora endophytica]GIG71200.1 transcriptional regulator [Phytomonospora endophytica]
MDDAADLSGFLRTRRARVDPASVGIPVDSRRRVTGLRREEVAHLSGVSVDYYVRLEQGRARQPSEQVLDALARVLCLDDVERLHLHRLARPPREGAPPAGGVRPELRRVLDAFDGVPAMIVNHRLDVLAGNRLTELLYGLAAPGYNTARHIFLDEGARDLYGDWEKCTRDVVGHLRHSAGRFPDDPLLVSLIGELSMGSDRFRTLWSRADVRMRTFGRKVFRHRMVGELDLHQENFALPGAPGQELVVLTAAVGSEAEAGLRLLASLGGAELGHSVSTIASTGKTQRNG